MSSPYGSELAKISHNFNEEVDSVTIPTLTDEMKKNHYAIVIPGLGQQNVMVKNASEMLEMAKEVEADSDRFNSERLRKRLYQFLQESKPGDMCWTGHMLPVIFNVNHLELPTTVFSTF